ncbi:MAG: NAD-dependent protein deacylase, partial [Deltaproteobacteria bacterium]|nr:NAD-dependent protein deacylase [Deltaproteobacteria bacterium]
MVLSKWSEDERIVVLSGAGLSSASGVPTFREADGLWERHRLEDVATPEAWLRDRDLVRCFYDARREAVARVQPNPGHHALVRLQTALGPARVMLVTQNIDGLLGRAGAPDVIELHGSLGLLRCEWDESHPHLAISGPQPPEARCTHCGAPLRPAVVW